MNEKQEIEKTENLLLECEILSHVVHDRLTSTQANTLRKYYNITQ